MEAILEFFKNPWFLAAVLCLSELVEFWLGRTELVKPGSKLEVVLSGIKKILELLGLIKPKQP